MYTNQYCENCSCEKIIAKIVLNSQKVTILLSLLNNMYRVYHQHTENIVNGQIVNFRPKIHYGWTNSQLVFLIGNSQFPTVECNLFTHNFISAQCTWWANLEILVKGNLFPSQKRASYTYSILLIITNVNWLTHTVKELSN